METRYYHKFSLFISYIGLLLVTGATSVAQSSSPGDPFCGITEASQEVPPPIASYPSSPTLLRGGKYKTANGTVRVMVIFVRFADDVLPGPNWPDYQTLPQWVSTPESF